MNARIIAAIAAFLSVIFKAHLSIATAGLVVTVSVPWFLLAALAAVSALLAWRVIHSIRRFKSSPYPRFAS